MAKQDRRADVVLAACALLAERGLEGFRVRAVAERAGMHHATLLHYFPSREALVDAVVGHLESTLAREGAHRSTDDAAAALGLEFHDLSDRLARNPAFFAVLSELRLRAARDPAVAASLGRMYARWRGHLRPLIQQGMARGQFRPDVPVDAVVESLLALFQGLALHSLGAGASGLPSDPGEWVAAALIETLRAKDGPE